jgi:hypothetical protein
MAAGEHKLNHVTAQPMGDPADPLMILRDLPEREREELAAVRAGMAATVPVTGAIPDWAEGIRGVER